MTHADFLLEAANARRAQSREVSRLTILYQAASHIKRTHPDDVHIAAAARIIWEQLEKAWKIWDKCYARHA